jgi:hypothetical protein
VSFVSAKSYDAPKILQERNLLKHDGFTLLIETTEEENNRRVRSQRIIKEACGTLANVFFAFQGAPQPALIETSGTLLISALVSLKHQGAAFSAHKSLQWIAEYCHESFVMIRESNLSPIYGAIVCFLKFLEQSRILH